MSHSENTDFTQASCGDRLPVAPPVRMVRHWLGERRPINQFYDAGTADLSISVNPLGVSRSLYPVEEDGSSKSLP